MADNVVANAGVGGATFATDQRVADSVHFPLTKLVFGALDTFNIVDDTVGNRIPIKLAEVGSVTVPISAANLPLPTGAAADATLTGGNQVSIVKGGAKGATAAAVLTSNPIDANTQALHVDGSKVTQPVSGTITANAGSGTFTVTGTVTANIGTSGSLALDATLTGGTQKAIPIPTTSGGLSIQKLISAATTNATSVKGSAGQVYSIYVHNINAAPRFLKLYNKATAPTVGTDVPVMTLPIPGNAAGAGFVLDTGGMGIAFGTGIGLAITAAVADNDATAVAANEIVVNLLYK